MRFDGKVALVTGAASGIGAAVADLFAKEGADVVGVDIAGDGDGILQADVSSPDDVQRVIQHAVDTYGGLDVLLNVAGVQRFNRVENVTLDEWNRHIAVNLTGPFLLSQTAIPHLIERNGNIVTVASNAGIQGQAYNSAYCASKGGVILLMKALAVELSKQSVRVNCICPGSVDTPLLHQAAHDIPEDADRKLMARLYALLPRFSSPAEIAGLAAFLASDAAGFITGAAIMIDGGTQS